MLLSCPISCSQSPHADLNPVGGDLTWTRAFLRPEPYLVTAPCHRVDVSDCKACAGASPSSVYQLLGQKDGAEGCAGTRCIPCDAGQTDTTTATIDSADPEVGLSITFGGGALNHHLCSICTRSSRLMLHRYIVPQLLLRVLLQRCRRLPAPSPLNVILQWEKKQRRRREERQVQLDLRRFCPGVQRSRPSDACDEPVHY